MAVVNRKRIGSSLSFEHFEFLEKVCKNNRQKQSVILELALDLLKEKLKTQNLSEVMEYVDSIKD